MNRLWKIIETENIKVKYRDLRSYKSSLHGLYLLDSSGPLILLDKNIEHNKRLMKCVLAEEIGHYRTAPRTNYLVAYGSYNLQLVMSQDERRALQWATDFLLPDSELCMALEKGHRSCFELAEYFDVTEWFVRMKLGLLKRCFRRTGLKVRGQALFEVELKPCSLSLE